MSVVITRQPVTKYSNVYLGSYCRDGENSVHLYYICIVLYLYVWSFAAMPTVITRQALTVRADGQTCPALSTIHHVHSGTAGA